MEIKKIYYSLCRGWEKFIRIPRRTKWFIQRGKRGYSDSDSYDAFDYLARVTSGLIRELAKDPTGCPASFVVDDDESNEIGVSMWKDELNMIADGFDAAIHLCELDFMEQVPLPKGEVKKKFGLFEVDYDLVENKQLRKKWEKQFDKGMRSYHKNFFSFWD